MCIDFGVLEPCIVPSALMIFNMFLPIFVLEKAMPYLQIVRAFSTSVIALCKRMYLVPVDVDEMFCCFPTFFSFTEYEMYTFLGGL